GATVRFCVAADRSMPPAPRVSGLPAIDTAPAGLVTAMPARDRPDRSLLVARFCVLLPSNLTVEPAVGTPAVQLVGAVAVDQFACTAPVEEVVWAGAAEARTRTASAARFGRTKTRYADSISGAGVHGPRHINDSGVSGGTLGGALLRNDISSPGRAGS